ncbi:MAG: lysophospholipid acyltransferase family protein [Candidatus Muiribacteriota bacterium]
MIKLKKTKRFIIYCFVLFLIDIFKKVSFSTSYRIASVISKIMFFASTRERNILMANLSYVSINTDEKRLMKKIFKNMGYTFVEFIKFSFMPFKKVKQYLEVQGEHHLKEALQKKRGVVLLTGHIGNWEMVGAHLGKKGYPVNALYSKPKSELYDKIIRKLRGLNKLKLIDNKNSFIEGIKCLRNNEILILLADQKSKENNNMIDFLGKPAPTPKGPAIFALKAKAEIVTYFVVRKKKRLKVIFNKLEYDSSKKQKEKVAEILTKMNRQYSEIIKKYPDQWAWFHNRWGIF